MNIRQRFSRYFYPQVLVILACGVLFSLLVFWFSQQKITHVGFLQKENTAAQVRAPLPGFKVHLQPSTPIWDFFGILPASASTEKNCTYTVHYLSEHPELWNTSGNISTSRFSFTKNDLLSLFQTQTQDIPLLLQQQFLAAAVNIVNGADPGAVEATMKDASQWIDAHPPRIDLPEADSQTGLQFIQQLQDYNDGNAGPGLCPGQSEPLAASANSAPPSLPATKPGITVPQSTGRAATAVTAHQAAQSLPTAQPPRPPRKNSGSGGSAPSGSAPAVPPLVSESPQQPPATSATSDPPPAVQTQQVPVNPASPPPTQGTKQAKGHRHSSKPQPAAGVPVSGPPQGQGDPQPQPADTPPPQPPDGGGGSNNGNGQGNGNSGNNGQGNNGGNSGNGNSGNQGNGSGNHYGNGNGNGNSGNHGNHGGGGHGKGH
jgi:hypothetical protein